LLKRNEAVGESKQRVIPTHPDICARMNAGSFLSDDYIAGPNELAAKALYPKALTWAIPPVSGTAACFLVGHSFSS